MKKDFLKFLTFVLILLGVNTVYAEKASSVETFQMDKEHSSIVWEINRLGFSNFSGKWMINEGKIILDEKNPQNSKVNVSININDMITGNPELDKNLKGSLFFDTRKFPKATFISNKVDLTGKDTAKVSGTLTVHGVSKPITLNMKLNKIGVNPMTEKQTIGFSGDTTLKRSDFDMKAYLPDLGDEVKIHIEVEAVKA